MEDRIERMRMVPPAERVRLLGVRLTPEEQHRVRLAAVTARVGIGDFVRGRLADVLVGEDGKAEQRDKEGICKGSNTASS